MSGAPDQKGARRVIDPQARTRALLIYPGCLACGERASNAHHVLPVGRGQSGDDVIENLVGLCGTGTIRCHGAFHGSPYTHRVRSTFPFEQGKLVTARRDREWVARRIGQRLDPDRPDVVAYVLGKLGRDKGLDYLERIYFYEPAG